MLFDTQNSQRASGEKEIMPQFVPAAATDLLTQDFHITEVVLTNVTGASVTVTIKDRQATPGQLFAAVSIPANTTTGVVFRGRWMPDGINWQASAANSIFASIRGY